MNNYIENGIRLAKENTKLFGRIEILRKEPAMIIDVSHNPAGLNALTETLKLHYLHIQKWNFVFGCMADKDIAGMLREIKEICNELICCSPKIERAAKTLVINEIALNLGFSYIKQCDTVKDAVEYAIKSDKPTIIAGSFYLIEEAMNCLKK